MLSEPPDADPHVRWCGRGRGEPGPYPITAAPDPMATFTRSGLFTPFTPIFNASGQPGISLPLYQGDDGLPLAVQLVGRPAGEAALLALASQVEAAAPWTGRRPPVS